MRTFHFELDPIDTQNFFDIVNDAIVNAMAARLDPTLSDSHKKWYNDHIKYLKELQAKIFKES